MRLLICCPLLVHVLACGDPLVGPTFLGTPILELRGVVQQLEIVATAEPPTNLRLSLFWIGFDSRDRQRPTVEQHTTLDSELTSFRLTLFDPPAREALTFVDLTEFDSDLGLALIVLYADNNENGALNSYEPTADSGPDSVLGASANHLVVYTSRALPATSRARELLGEIPPGYHLYETLGESSCSFREAEGCRGSGGLREVSTSTTTITLTLSADRAEVFVPNPALAESGTSSDDSNNLYGPRP